MKESILRQLVLLLLLSTIVCLLWAVGSNARKRVELEKSRQLNERLEKLTLANTVITDNLKNIQNRIAELKQKELELKASLEKHQQEKETLKEKLVDRSQSSEELALLKQANTDLGEELIRLKQQDLALRQEIELLKAGSMQEKQKKQPSKTTDGRSTQTQQKNTGNFAW